MNTTGRHLIVEYIDCDVEILNDCQRIENLLIEAARKANTTIVGSIIKPFYPQGVSGVVVIEESHLSIHTWPEEGYAAVDFFTCGKGDPWKAHEIILEGLKANKYEYLLLIRGQLNKENPINIKDHFTK